MIVVSVHLHSARTGKVTKLSKAIIYNAGGTGARGDYEARAYPKGSVLKAVEDIDAKAHRKGQVKGHARRAEPVLSLVVKALQSMGYG